MAEQSLRAQAQTKRGTKGEDPCPHLRRDRAHPARCSPALQGGHCFPHSVLRMRHTVPRACADRPYLHLRFQLVQQLHRRARLGPLDLASFLVQVLLQLHQLRLPCRNAKHTA
jgi:hypothetical protein